MEFLKTIPALFKLAVIFIYIIFSIRRKVSLGTAFLTGAILSGGLYGLGPFEIFKVFGASAFSPKTISLALIVTLILLLSSSMEKTGQMASLLLHFKGLVKSSRLNVIIFPAMIGLLPMPGGAVFSAPMVKELGRDLGYSTSKLSFINYWFRHVWEYWWPMYPGILLVPAMTDIRLYDLMIYHLPLSVFALLIGYLFLKSGNVIFETGEGSKIHVFLWQLIPILIAVFPGLLGGTCISKFFPRYPVGRESGLILALLLSNLWVWRVNKFPWVSVRKLFDSQMVKMAYMVVTILLFKEILEASRAVDAIAHELTLLNIPVVLVVALLPFLTGLVTGISVAFVGSTFPIIIHMAGAGDASPNILPYIQLAMTCGFTGVLLSPVHLCLILSNEYFETNMANVYKILCPACFLLVFSSFLYFYFLML